MRFIDLEAFTPSAEWLVTANHHTTTIIPYTRQQRRNYINTIENKCWNEQNFLNSLKNYGKRKCWYSEINREVQLYVDHFRPKLRVTKITGSYNYPEAGTRPQHNGYFWLTYNYQNFRIVSNISNQRKGGYFPLATHSASIENYHPPGDISTEVPMLLDPCVEEDIGLIMYNITKPQPVYTKNENTHNYHRVKISIMAYNLDDSLLQTLRMKTLKMCNSLCAEAKKAYDSNDLISFSINCSKLVDMLSPDAEFTMMIKHRLEGMNKDWLNLYVIEEARSRNFI